MTTLFKHQEDFLKRNPRRRILVWETGTGKTLAALSWAKKNASEVLIICPKGLKENWRRSVSKFFPEGYVGCEIVSKEEFKKLVGKGELRKYESVIVDEMHYFSGISSQLSKALNSYLNSGTPVTYVLGLTATPYMSTPLNIYVLGKHMGMGGRWNYPWFMSEFFHRVPMGQRLVPILKEGMQDRVQELVWEIADTVKLRDCADVPDDVMEAEYFPLTASQKKGIESITDMAHIVRWTKKHQVCGGTLKGDEYEESKTFESEKANRLSSLCAEIRCPIVVCRYNHELEFLREKVEKETGKKARVINGDVPGDERQAILDTMGEDGVLLVNAAVSEGWQLPISDTVIFYSYDFALKNYVQMKGRIQRIDNVKKCRYVSLVAKDTIDEDVYKSIVEDKMDFHLSIYEKTPEEGED